MTNKILSGTQKGEKGSIIHCSFPHRNEGQQSKPTCGRLKKNRCRKLCVIHSQSLATRCYRIPNVMGTQIVTGQIHRGKVQQRGPNTTNTAGSAIPEMQTAGSGKEVQLNSPISSGILTVSVRNRYWCRQPFGQS